MNREDIIRIARETGVEWLMHNQFYKDHLQHFAALVAAAERNRIWNQENWTEYERGIAAAAKAEEREACAKLLESRRSGANELMDATREMDAYAIRARGNT